MPYANGALLAAAIVCLSGVADTAVGEEGYVELPAEFYFGRWVPGHLWQGYVQSRRQAKTEASSDYSYSNAQFKLGLRRIQNCILFSDDGSLFATSSFSGYWRPFQNLQIGIDSLEYSRLETHDPYSERSLNRPGEELLGRSEDFLLGQASFCWSNHLVGRLSGRLSKLMYIDSTVVGDGTILVKGRSVRRSIKQAEEWRADPDFDTEVKRDILEWQHEIKGFWGVREDLNFHCSFVLGTRPTNVGVITAVNEPGAVSLTTREREVRVDDHGYSLRAVYAPAEDLFLDAGWARQLWSERNTQVQETIVLVPPGVLSESNRSESVMDGRTESAYVTMTYLTTGQFLPGLVLDDYRGYYRHMLSRGQVLLRSTIARSWWTNTLDVSGRSFECSTEVGLALSGRCQLDAIISYDWFHVSNPHTDAHIRSSLSLRWRSFEYCEGTGPGWRNDLLLDAAIGPLLSPNDMFASVTFSPPPYQAQEFAGDGAFDARKFQYYDDARLSLEVVRGLLPGVEIALSGASSIRLSDRGIFSTRHTLFGFISYDLRGSYRLCRRVELSTSFSDLFFPGQGKVGDRAEIRGDLRVLL